MPRKKSRLALAGLVLAALSRGAAALGLGEIASQSSLGEPLRLTIAVIADPGDDLRAECFQLAPPGRQTGDELPQLNSARFAIEGTSGGRRLVVSSPRPINEPILRVVLRAGCEQNALVREFVLLLDPPFAVAGALTSVADEHPVVGKPIPPAVAAAPVPANTGLITEDAPPPAKASRSAGVPGAQASLRPHRTAAAGKTRGPISSGVLTRELRPVDRSDRLSLSGSAGTGAAPATPRLVLSTALSDLAPGQTPLSDDALAVLRAKQARLKAVPDDQDLSLSVEAELVVLDKRLRELQSTLDAANAQIKSMAEREAPSPPPVPVQRPAKAERAVDYSSWFVGVALAIALAAVALMLVQRRRRRAANLDIWPPELATPQAAPAAPQEPPRQFAARPEVSAAPAPPESPSPAKPGLSYYHVGDTSHQLSVSELAQVTEEARVFLTLGHPDKAILALREHVDSHADTAPAPWLMLLDLYRRTDDRGEYERSAAEFRHRYNAFIPPWEDPGAGQEGPGLEAYPHLVKQICDLWGNPTCKVFLDELLYDNRGGNRIGFNLTAYQDIMLLRSLLEAHGTETPTPKSKLLSLSAAGAAPRVGPVADLEFELDQDLLPATSYRCALEMDHPGILERLALNWGTPHVVHFLESLLFADHTAKSAFGETALSELMLLHEVAVELAGLRHDDNWEQDPSMGRKSARQ
ncbi:MAG: hypothetical protein HYZ17_12450 [Betaproteobacteria bacterium]|nr:hypothetical protein [Betaproteobacteria bacterium]